MADTRSRIAALSPAQQAVLEARIRGLTTAAAAAPDRVRPRDRSRPTPLGIAQQREWAVSRLRGANNVPGAFRVEGAVDPHRLGRVLTRLLEQHEILRTTVEVDPSGVPVQVVRPVTPVTTPVVDLSALPPAEQRDRLRDVCRAELLRPFPPADPQRLRITLVRLAADVHVCLLVTDHASSDAWSLAILMQEIAALYARPVEDDDPGRPRTALQFADFAAWQRERFGPDHQAAEVRHWARTLAGIPAAPRLPADREPPARPTYAGDTYAVEVPAPVVAGLRAFSEQDQTSLFSVLLAACSVLLSRHLDQPDVVIGSLVSGRTRIETEQLVGCFANPLPLRMRLTGHQTLHEVVHQARETLAVALDHQDVPFDRLVEELGLDRASAQNSLSRVWINVITVPTSSLQLPGLTFAPAAIDLGLASVDLTLSAVPEDERLRLEWQYMTELFDHETVALLAEQFLLVLQQVVACPDRTVDEVELGPPDDDGVAGEAGGAPDADEAELVGLLRRRVVLAPHAPAVVGNGAGTTYAELGRAAGQLTGQLRAAGVAPGSSVGLLIDGPALGPAVLGVLAAGGRCLLIDPAVAPEQVVTALGAAGGEALVTVGPLEGATAGAFRVIGVHRTRGAEPPAALLESARSAADRLGLGAGDRFLAFRPPGPGWPVDTVLATWLAGGAVVIPPRDRIGDPTDLADLLAAERVSVLGLSTAAWRAWADELGRRGTEPPGCLRLVVLDGDRPEPAELASWQQRRPVPLQVSGR